MYTYEVGYHSYEECPITVIQHIDKYTKAEFDDIVSDAYAHIFKTTLIEHKFQTHPEYLIDGVIEYLINEKGFKAIEITASFSPFGWASVGKIIPIDDYDHPETDTHNYWPNDIDECLELIRNKIKHLD
jgi:hypothetical protein